MEYFTYLDLRNYLLERVYFDKYVKLADHIKRKFSDDENFQFYDYLYKNKDHILISAENKKELDKKIKLYFKKQFKEMNYGKFDEIKSKIKDWRTSYP